MKNLQDWGDVIDSTFSEEGTGQVGIDMTCVTTIVCRVKVD